jgi:hypothetical protein
VIEAVGRSRERFVVGMKVEVKLGMLRSGFYWPSYAGEFAEGGALVVEAPF